MLKINILKSTLLFIPSLLFFALIFSILSFAHINAIFLQTKTSEIVCKSSSCNIFKIDTQNFHCLNSNFKINLMRKHFTFNYNKLNCTNLLKNNNLNQENALNCENTILFNNKMLLSTFNNLSANENTNNKAPTLSFKTYIVVLLITLPIITVLLLLIIPKKTDNLLALDLNKNKKNKVNLGIKIKHDGENL